MYKMKVMPAILVFTLCLVSLVGSQMNAADKSIGLFGNLGIPQSQNNFSDLYENGYGFGLEYRKHLINNTKLVINFVQSSYTEKPDAMRNYYLDVMYNWSVSRYPGNTVVYESGNTTGGGLIVQQFSLNLLQYVLTSGLNVYFTGGPGMYRYSYDEIETTAMRYLTDTTTGETEELMETFINKEYVKYCFAIDGGLGIEYSIGSKIAVFAEGKYNYVHYPRESGGAYRNFITGVIGLRFGLDF